MEPAATIIKKLGGEAMVADITATALSAPYRWQYAREQGGTGGRIPQRHHRSLLAYASRQGISLSADEFLPPDDGSNEVAA
jgi:hypothetical protein